MLSLLALPVVVQAQFTFTTNNGAITITGYTGTGGDVTIPSSTNGYPVTVIGSGAFMRKSHRDQLHSPRQRHQHRDVRVFGLLQC